MFIGIERIKEEYNDFIKFPIPNIGATIGLVDKNDYKHWKVKLIGPQDSSYSNGLFELLITFPDNYPISPPEICFLTPIYHLNVNPKVPKGSSSSANLGHVFISNFFPWKTDCNMKELLANTFALFYYPDPKSPYAFDRAKEFIEDRALYEKKAQYFTKKYSHPLIKYNYSRTEDWNFNF